MGSGRVGELDACLAILVDQVGSNHREAAEALAHDAISSASADIVALDERRSLVGLRVADDRYAVLITLHDAVPN